jgi:hypothetical protein
MRWNQELGGIVMRMNSSHCKLIHERILKLGQQITEINTCCISMAKEKFLGRMI